MEHTSENKDYQKQLEEQRKNLERIIEKNFPGKYSILEICLSVRAMLEIEGITQPLLLVLIGPPSSFKTTILEHLETLPDIYKSDSFTPKSFVSHYASVRFEDLEKLDLLKSIQNKLFVTPDLAPIFSIRYDQLTEIIGILTRILDGKGFQKNSGVHGQRGYDNVFFVWLGAIVYVPKSLWSLLAKLGPKIYFLDIENTISKEDELRAILNGFKNNDHNKKITQGQEQVQKLWGIIKEFPSKNNGKIIWDKSKDVSQALKQIARYSQILARLRGYIPTDETSHTSGSNYGFQKPIIENPQRAANALYNIAQGHAIIHGRNFVTIEDIGPIEQIALSNGPKERVLLLRSLLSNNGKLTTSQVIECLNTTRSTALRHMKMMVLLGLCDEIMIDGKTKSNRGIVLAEYFDWILTETSE